MCGIAGLIEPVSGMSREQGRNVLEKQLSKIRHRGPDGRGSWDTQEQSWQVFLGHDRLSILDLATGAQPMKTQGDLSIITFNGEIFNFHKLRKNLEDQGVRFQTRSDTEVLLYQFEKYGVEGLAALNGMFAFAVWDARAKRLTLVRDRCGIKPLYYASLPHGGFVFCSELNGILEHPGVQKRLSLKALSSYFFSDYIHAPLTLFEGIFKLEPGHFISWEGGRTSQSSPYLNSAQFTAADSPQAKHDATPESEMPQKLWDQLKAAVARQLVADVPVGVFLSGGIDSSSIAACAQTLVGEPIKTFSIAFEEQSYDESAYARQVAQHIGSDHIEQKFSDSHLLENFDKAIGALDEPLADPSLLPTYLLSQVASRSVKVALGGDGGDELLAGYPTYQAHRISEFYALIPAWMRNQATEFIAKLPVQDRYQSLEWKLKRFTGRWDDHPLLRHLRWMSSLDLDEVKAALPGFKGLPATYAETQLQRRNSASSSTEQGSPLNSFLDLDFKTYLPGSVLTKVDRASMAHGLEVRPPFLDNELIDFARALPAHFKLRGSKGKYLLKLAAARHLPVNIIRRPKKGFGIPIAIFLRGPLKKKLEAALSDTPLWKVLNREIFLKWFEEHQSLKEDHARPLWAFLVLHTWLLKEGIDVKT